MRKIENGVVTEMSEEEIAALPTPTPDEQIIILKSQLEATDYKALKYAEGEITAEEYEPILLQRRSWRAQINSLESEAE